MFRKPKTPDQKRETSPLPRADVFSYYSSRSRNAEAVGRGDKTLPIKKSTLLRHLPTIAGSIAIMVCIVYMVTLNPQPRVVSYAESTPNLLQDQSKYSDYAAHLIATSIWNRTKLTADTSSIANELKKQFPELAEATVVMPIANRRPILELQPAEPRLLLTSEQAAFLVDKNGRALVGARDAPTELIMGLPQINDESGTDIIAGEYVLTREKAEFITVVWAQLEGAALEVESMVLPPLPHELHVRLKGEGYYIKFHMFGDARIQSGAFLAVREELSRNIPTEYIDVRLEDKVYVR